MARICQGFFPILNRIVLLHLAAAVFNNIRNIKSFVPFTRDAELGYRIDDDDDVSLLTIPQLEAFIFVRWSVEKTKQIF